MSEHFVSRGFVGKRREAGDLANRIPPGQHAVSDFPVLSAGPTPRTRLVKWTFTLEGLVRQSARWSWEKFLKLPAQDFVVDIHCVTKWTKLDTRWRGVSLDTLFEHVEIDRKAQYLTAFSDGGYTTNLPLPDAINGRAFVAYSYDGQPLARAGHDPATVANRSRLRPLRAGHGQPQPAAHSAARRPRPAAVERSDGGQGDVIACRSPSGALRRLICQRNLASPRAGIPFPPKSGRASQTGPRRSSSARRS